MDMLVMNTVAGHVRALREGDDAAKTAAARALYTRDRAIKIAFAEAGGIPPLVELLRDGSMEAKPEAAWALGSLAFNNAANQVQIAEAGGIPLLVELVRNGGDAKWSTMNVLCSLALNNDANAVAIAVTIGLEAIVELARSGHVKIHNVSLVLNAGLPAKRKAALVVAQLIEAAAPRTRVSRYIKAAIGSYL
ncbi:hypothetical protein JL720_7042 [Aureococcus anophagefferens]|nr:hypothetical protein JL720_7042 [Aureococcus anophagefferens]